MKCNLCEKEFNSENFVNEYEKISVKNPQDYKDIFTYIFCKNCGVGFLENIESVKIKENYNNDYNEYESASENGIFKKILDFFYYPRNKFVQDLNIKNNSIFDIGCGNGTFLQSVSSNFAKVYGSDYNQSALKIAKSKIPSLILMPENIGNVRLRFDVITLWHVLEHIPNPVEFVSNIKKMMNKDSTLVLEVPNSNSIMFSIFKENYKWISLPEHLFFYNEKSLSFLFKKCELDIIKIYYPRMFPLMLTKTINNPFLKIVSVPISIFLYIITPVFKGTESVRIVVKKNEK